MKKEEKGMEKTKKTHNLHKILPLYAKNKGLFVLLIIFMLISGLASVPTPIFLARVLEAISIANYDRAVTDALIMCSLGLVSTIANAIREFLYTKMDLKIRYMLAGQVIDSINRTKMSTLDSTKLGVLAERMSSDINAISDSYLDMINLIFNILTNAAFCIYIAFLNIYIFLVIVVYVVLLYFVCEVKSKIWINGRKVTKRANEIARSSYYEQIKGIRDVKLLDIKENVTAFSNSKLHDALDAELSVSNKRNVIRRVQSVLSILFELTFLLVGVMLVEHNLMLSVGLIIIYAYYGRVEGLVSYISSFKEYSAEGEISATRVFEIIEKFEKEEFGTEEIHNFSGKIELKNVSFSYADVPVLRDCSLTFESGKMTAIVGKSGSGKTTILSLISKLYDATEGEILFDDKNINCLTEKSIHSNVGEVSQAPYIFNASIKQNLLFVKPDATDAELEKVLSDVLLSEDVHAMREGMNSEIGENGIKLSGGQKQRIAIARLLLRDSKVLVFDEATSSLDNSSQGEIVKLLEKFKQNRTIIIVAHRLSTIIGADKIYMIDDGRVIAEGTHKQLIKTCPPYRELYLLEENNMTDK